MKKHCTDCNKTFTAKHHSRCKACGKLARAKLMADARARGDAQVEKNKLEIAQTNARAYSIGWK